MPTKLALFRWLSLPYQTLQFAGGLWDYEVCGGGLWGRIEHTLSATPQGFLLQVFYVTSEYLPFF